MDPLTELAAPGVSVTLAGKNWFLSPLRLVDWAEAARLIAGRTRPPLAIVKEHLASLAPEFARHLLDLAYRDERYGELYALDEVERWFATPEGHLFRLWLMLRQRHAELSLAATEALLLAETDAARHEQLAERMAEGAALPASGFFPTPWALATSAPPAA